MKKDKTWADDAFVQCAAIYLGKTFMLAGTQNPVNNPWTAVEGAVEGQPTYTSQLPALTLAYWYTGQESAHYEPITFTGNPESCLGCGVTGPIQEHLALTSRNMKCHYFHETNSGIAQASNESTLQEVSSELMNENQSSSQSGYAKRKKHPEADFLEKKFQDTLEKLKSGTLGIHAIDALAKANGFINENTLPKAPKEAKKTNLYNGQLPRKKRRIQEPKTNEERIEASNDKYLSKLLGIDIDDKQWILEVCGDEKGFMKTAMKQDKTMRAALIKKYNEAKQRYTCMECSEHALEKAKGGMIPCQDCELWFHVCCTDVAQEGVESGTFTCKYC